MNNCAFIGRLGRDAETRFTQGGKAVTNFSVAVDSGFGDNKKTVWIDCAAWGERFEKVAEYIRKGDRIGVVGEIGTREHDGKTYVTLNVRDIDLLGEKREGQSKQQRSEQRSAPPESHRDSGGSLDGEDIPFLPRGKRSHWE